MPFWRQRQRRHEDDEQHEQHVDERRDVHVRRGLRRLACDDLLGAVVHVGVRTLAALPAGRVALALR